MLCNLFRRLMDRGHSEFLLRVITALPPALQQRLGLQPLRVRVR